MSYVYLAFETGWLVSLSNPDLFGINNIDYDNWGRPDVKGSSGGDKGTFINVSTVGP